MIRKALIATLALMAAFVAYSLMAGYRELGRRRARGPGL